MARGKGKPPEAAPTPPAPGAPAPGRPAAAWRPWLAVAVLAVAVLLGANHRLVTGKSSGVWDADSFFAPYYMIVADHARAGRLMRWNPWVFAGSPDCFEPQFGAFSPLTVGLGAITGGHEAGFRAYWLVIWAIGGVGIICLGRHLRAPPWAAGVTALGFMFSGIYTGHAEHTSTIEAISFLPWIVWRLDAALLNRRLIPAAQAGALWGLAALAGYPGLTVLTGIYAALWVLGRLCFPRTPTPGPRVDAGVAAPVRWHRRLGFAAVGMALFVVVGAVVLSPTYMGFLAESPGYSDRAGPLARDVAIGSNALHPAAVSTFASPYLPILKWSNWSLYSYNDISTCSIYVGAAVFALGVLAVVSRPRDRHRWYLLALGVLWLLTGMGKALPLRGWLYDLLPPTRYFRHAGMFRMYHVFTLGALALLGAGDLAARDEHDARRAWKRFLIVSAVSLVAAVATFGVVAASLKHPGDHRTFAALHLVVVWGVTAELAGLGFRWSGRTRRRIIPALFVLLAAADGFMTVELSKLTMYLDRAQRWEMAERNWKGSLDLTGQGLARRFFSKYDGKLYDNKNMAPKIPVLWSYAGLGRSDYLRKLAENPVLRASALGADRVWLSPAAVEVRPTKACFAALADRSTAVGGPVLAVSRPEDMVRMAKQTDPWAGEADAVGKIAQAPPAKRVSVEVRKYTPNELTFDVTCGEQGWLLVTDRWSRGWRASVNDSPQEVWGGNFVFRAVRVGKGRNRVSFTFHAFGHPWGLLASWATMGALLIAPAARPAVRRLRRRRPQAGAAPRVRPDA